MLTLLGYPDRYSAAPGEKLAFHISLEQGTHFDAELVRVYCGDCNPEGPGVQARLYVRVGSELQRRSVQLGRRAAGQVEVLAGLQAGDEVLISQPPSDDERLNLP